MIGAKGLPGLLPVGGGVETHVEHLASSLVADGHKVTVYVRPYANPLNKTEWKGIKIVTLPSWHRKNFDAITHVLLSSLHALTEKYDVIHYHGIGPSTLCWIPRLFKRSARVIVTFHSRDQFHEKWGLFARVYLAFGEWTAVHFPHATIAVSHGIQLLCSMMFKSKKTYYIPNGVHLPEKISGIGELKQFDLHHGQYFLHLARLVPHKAQDDTIKAFLSLDTNDKLVIAGSASFDNANYLEKLKKMAGDDPRIIFTGHQGGITLKQLIANCRAIVHPSRSEGLSVVILEAMSYGRMVIMSDIPENLELIDHSGIAVPVGDVEALANAMRWTIDNPQLADERGVRAREIIRRLYSWESVTKRIEKVYKNQVPTEEKYETVQLQAYSKT
ncbi:MAG: glycosyltransferase family 4 protein [Patescibacteria group bacterium]|nr:glycosyltransferase family 4 protein [Patescibacteria group bacterium]